jgi:hypothetical protein
MRRLFFILLLVLNSTIYSAKKGFFWSQGAGFLGNQRDALTSLESKAIKSSLYKSLVPKDLEGQFESGFFKELDSVIAISKALKKNKPLHSHIISLQSGVGYQISNYLSVEIDHLIFRSIASLNPDYFEFEKKITLLNGLIGIGKVVLPLHLKYSIYEYNLYIPFGGGFTWTTLYNGPESLSLPMRLSALIGLGIQYELLTNITIYGEWVHMRVPEVSSFNLFKIGGKFYF